MAYLPVPNQSVSGTTGSSVIGLTPVSVSNFPANPSVSGTVNVGNFPANQSVSGAVTVAFPANQSVSGTVNVGNLPANQSISGAVTVTFPTNQNVSGSVVAFQGAGWSGSVAATVTNFPTTQNVSGSIVAFQGAGWSGSVAATITNANVNVSGSVIAFQAGTQSASIYGMRNDAVASFLGADLTIRPIITDSAGRTVIKPFAADDSAVFRFQTSVVSGSVTLIQASAIGKRSYLTDWAISNTGSVATLITFQGGDTSILGYTIAPGGGGSNKHWLVPVRTNPSQDLAFKMSPSASVLYVNVTGYQAP